MHLRRRCGGVAAQPRLVAIAVRGPRAGDEQHHVQDLAEHRPDEQHPRGTEQRVPGDRRLINGLATTMATIFPSIYTVDIPGSLNTMIFATKQPTQPENFAANLLALSNASSIHPPLIHTIRGIGFTLRVEP